jgi:hypothetical protein
MVAGIDFIGVAVALTIAYGLYQQNGNISPWIIGACMGLVIGLLQWIFIIPWAVSWLFFNVICFSIGIFLSQAVGLKLPDEFGSPAVGGLIGLTFAVLGSFYIERFFHRMDCSQSTVWIMFNTIGWSLGFWIARNAGMTAYTQALPNLAAGKTAADVLLPSMGMGGLLGGAIVGIFTGIAIAYSVFLTPEEESSRK